MLACVVTAKGSPGASTTALALTVAWPEPVLLAECDPAGGDVRSGLLAGMGSARNLVNLATVSRHGELTPKDLARQLYSLDSPTDSKFVLPGLVDPMSAGALDGVWEPLASVFRACRVKETVWPQPVDVLADCGRLDHRHFPWPLLRSADVVIVAVRASLSSVLSAAPHMAHLRHTLADAADTGPAVAAALIEDGPYSRREVEDALGVDVVIRLPYDRTSVRNLVTGAESRRLTRSGYLRAARTYASALRSYRTDPVEPETSTTTYGATEEGAARVRI